MLHPATASIQGETPNGFRPIDSLRSKLGRHAHWMGSFGKSSDLTYRTPSSRQSAALKECRRMLLGHGRTAVRSSFVIAQAMIHD